MKRNDVVVIGGTGFVGTHLVAKLVAQNRRVLVPTRRRDNGRHLFMLPTVDVVEADVHNPAVLRQLLDGQDAVINLVGILHGDVGVPYGPAFRRAHVELPAKILAACKDCGVERLLQMSALGAAADAPSMYLRSRADGEAAVRDGGAVHSTIFRSSVIFGPGDQFLNLFALLQKWFFVMPLAGAEARFQPVYVGDVVRALVRALEVREAADRTIELAGPQVYSLRELVALAGKFSGHSIPIVALPAALGRLQAWFLEHAPGAPLMSRDNLDSMRVPSVSTSPPDAALAQLLGLDAMTSLEQIAPEYLSASSQPGRYDRYRQNPSR